MSQEESANRSLKTAAYKYMTIDIAGLVNEKQMNYESCCQLFVICFSIFKTNCRLWVEICVRKLEIFLYK